MRRNTEIEAIGQQLEGIIALLLSLASIADRACFAPAPVAQCIVSLLCPAEAVARGFVCGAAVPPEQIQVHGDDAAVAAAGLAARFRLLAIVLAGVVARLLAGWRRGCKLHWHRSALDAAKAVSTLRNPVFAPRSLDSS